MKNVFLILIVFSFMHKLPAQDLKENKSAKIVTWTLLQLLPSPTLYQDSDDKNARVQFGFMWHITPINFSFSSNKYVSPVQFFYINPVRRFTGSAEIFLQPELATASFSYADLSVFGISAGPRLIFPIYEMGENLSFSLAAKYTYRKDLSGGKNYYYGAEAGVYVLGGMMGLQYTQNFNTRTKFNISLYIKYF